MAQGTPSFLPDRFDDVPRDKKYVGIHRSTRSSASVFAPIGIALGAVVLLVLGGLWFVDRSASNLTLEDTAPPVIDGALDPQPEEAPVVTEEPVIEEALPVTDPTQIDTEGLTLTVLNGTAARGMAGHSGHSGHSRLCHFCLPSPSGGNGHDSRPRQRGKTNKGRSLMCRRIENIC